MNHLEWLKRPGGDLAHKGFADLKAGVTSKESLLILMCRSEFERLGMPVEWSATKPGAVEADLYRLIQREVGDEAHSVYNSLQKRILSFISCSEGAERQEM